MKTSANGITFIKKHEGFKNKCYRDVVGLDTIGVGHLIDKKTEANLVKATLTDKQVEELLAKDLLRFENAVNANVKVPLTQNQFDALVSFSFNVGIGAFSKSTLLKVINAKEFHKVGSELLRWNKAGGKAVQGLTNRRKSEHALFILA